MVGKRENFGSRSAVIMTMAGSAIGLGNIWRFPYMVGEHGGAAFIVLYVCATLLVSLPVFITEVVIGRRSRHGAYRSMSVLKPGSGIWKTVGLLAVMVPLLINSYYSVIGGWSVDYLFRACTASFVKASPDAVTSIFGEMVSSPWEPLVMHLLFLGVCSVVVVLGVRSGIEKFSKISIPLLFLMIIVIIAYSVTMPGAREGVRYLLRPDFSQINARSFAYALGQSFYSLSLGMGAIITYGSYVYDKEDIVLTGAGTAFSDLMFAILAGFAIMPAVFSAGLEPGAGPGLIFQTIPYVFSSMAEQMPEISAVVAVTFFLTIVIAAMTSCISLIEVGVSFLVERFGVSRKKSCLLLFLLCGGLGVLCSLSFGPLSSFVVCHKSLFDILDWFCSNIMLLFLSFMFVIFVGFVMKKRDVWEEVTNCGERKINVRLFDIIYFQIKWVAPVAIALIFVSNFIL